jgi:hypothetical protein
VARRSGWLKAAIGLAVLAVLGVLFVRSAQSVRSEPYTVSRERLHGWTLAAEPSTDPSGVMLGLQAPREFASVLFGEVFSRTGESMSGPVPAQIPLVLHAELASRAAAALSGEALLALARESGLEGATLQPKCMAHRRISAPGITRQMYFVLFDLPAFSQFRQKVATRVQEVGGTFDPAALSPAIIVAASDAMFSQWQPLRADAQQDCFAPVEVR